MNTHEKREALRAVMKGGGLVDLLVSMGPAGVKKVPVRVLNVERAAAFVKKDADDEGRLVRFTALELRPSDPPRVPVAQGASEARQSSRVVPMLPVRAVEPATKPERSGDMDDVKAYLEMGTGLLARMRERQEELAEEDAALEEEAKSIGERRVELRVESAKLRRMVAQLSVLEEGEESAS